MALYSVEVVIRIVRTSGEHLDIQAQQVWSSPVLEWRSEARQLTQRVADRLMADPKDRWIPWEGDGHGR